MEEHDRNLATVRRVYDALKARDTDTIQSVFSPDIEVYQSPELPWGGIYRGHDGLFTFFLSLVEHIESEVTQEGMFAAGDHVVQRGRTRGTVRANGAAFDIPEVHLFELHDGIVTRYESYIDTPAMLAALRGESDR